jgi:hypothetical protein
MPQHRYTSMQICIICFLVFVLGTKTLQQYPEWFNGVGYNKNFNPSLVGIGLGQIGRAEAAERFITLGSATSPQDSGFLDYIIPIFRTATGLEVHVESVGTGHALAIGARGNVDALLVHDRAGEDRFVADGYGVDRRDVMYDDFVIVGPSSDPAGIRGLRNAGQAFAAIAAKSALFASRGDDGGTYGWSGGFGSWRASNPSARRGTPIWIKASARLSNSPPRLVPIRSLIGPLGPISRIGRTLRYSAKAIQFYSIPIAASS